MEANALIDLIHEAQGQLWVDKVNESHRLYQPPFPTMPSMDYYNRDAQTISDLDPITRKIYLLDIEIIGQEQEEVQGIRTNLTAIRTLIRDTVPETFYPEIRDKDIHGQICALKDRFAPSQFVEIVELYMWWLKLIQPPRGRDILEWCDDWSRFLHECKNTGEPGLDGRSQGLDPILHWCWALLPLPLMHDWVSMWLARLPDEKDLTLPVIIKQLRFKLTWDTSFAYKLQQSIAPNLQTPEPKSSKSTRSPPRCVCGANHWYRNCPYLIESIRPQNWRPNITTQQTVSNKLRNDRRFSDQVKNARRSRQLPDFPQTHMTGFFTYGTPPSLEYGPAVF